MGRLWTLMGLMLSVLLLGACTDGEAPDESVDEPAGTAESSEEATDEAGEPDEAEPPAVQGASLSTSHVQDLWLFEGFEVMDADGTRDVNGELFDWLESAVDEVVELPGDATLHLVDALDAGLLGPDEQPREDVDVVAGYLEFEEAPALAILGTAHEGAPPIGYQDHLDIDLTAVEDITAGDVLTYRLSFLQAIPGEAPEEEAGLDSVELLAERLDAGRYLYAGYRDDDGQIHPGYIEGELAPVVEGSDRARPPAKAHDMIDGMGDAVTGCQGLACIPDSFRNLGPDGGGGSSWDNAKCNGNIGGACPPPDPTPPGGICPYPPCGSSHGDPYLTPYDGWTINFHLIGEFVLTAGDDLEVQIRTAPASLRRGLAWNTGVAIGSDDRHLTIVFEEDEVVSRVDGEPVPAEELEAALRAVGWNTSVLHDTRLQVTTEQGHTVTVLLRLGRNRFLDVYVDLEGEPRGFIGWLGAAHPDEPTGFVSRDGEELERQISDRRTRYEVFGESWRISDEESLFDYAEGESTATFTDRDFPPEGGVESDDLDRDDPEVARAEAICRAAGVDNEPILSHCILDLWATGDLAVVRSALTAERTRQVRDGEVDGEVFAPWSAWESTSPIPDGAVEVDWTTSVRNLIEEYGLEVGDRLTIACPPEGDGRTDTRIWGTDVYWTNSPVCACAVHVGQATMDEGGAFEVEILEEVHHPDIEVEPRNGIDPGRWARRASAFRVVD